MTMPTGASAGGSVPDEVKTLEGTVRDIDLAEPVPAIAGVDRTGRRALRAYVLVRLFTEPLGTVLVDLPPDGISAADLAAAIDRELGPRIRHRAADAGVRLTGPLGTDRIVPRRVVPYLQERDEILLDPPHIAVSICTRNQSAGVRRAVESVLSCGYPRFRIVIVDNAPSDDRVKDVAHEMAERGPVSYVVEPRPGVSYARNRAMRETAGEISASTDDDAIVDRYWLAEIARAFSRYPQAAVLSGPTIPAELDTRAQLLFEQYGGHSKGRGFTSRVFSPGSSQDPLYPLPPFGTGVNMVWRPGALESVGGFDPALGTGSPAMGSEDTLAFTKLLRAGGTMVYHAGAFVRHHHRRDMAGLERQMLGYGSGLTAAYTSLVREHPAVLIDLAKLAPKALHDLYSGRTAGVGDDFPRELLRANRRGMLHGPRAYLEGRRRNGHYDTTAGPGRLPDDQRADDQRAGAAP